MNKRNFSFLISIVAIGAFLRLYNIEQKMRFIWDEGRDMMAIRSMIVNRDLTLFGPFNESEGSRDFFGVFHYYLMAPWLYLADFNPLGPAVFTAGLGIVSIALVYWCLVVWGLSQYALPVASLYAVSPLVIQYVLWPWNPNTTPFFGLLYFMVLRYLFRLKQVRLSIIAGLLLGLLFQLHYFTVVVALPWLWWWIFALREKRWWHIAAFAGAWFVPNSTFVLFDLTHEGLYRKIVWESFFSGGSQQMLWFRPFVMLLSPIKLMHEIGSRLFGHPFLGVPASLLFLFSLGLTLRESWRKKQLSLFGVLALSWIGFLGISFVFPNLIDPYHANPLFFGYLLFIFAGLMRLLSRQLWRFVVVILMLVVMVIQVRPFRQPTWAENMPRVRVLGTLVGRDAPLDVPFNVAAFTDAHTRAERYRYFVEVAGKRPLGVTEYPKAIVLYVITPHDAYQVRTSDVWELQTFRGIEPIFLGSSEGVSVFKLDKRLR